MPGVTWNLNCPKCHKSWMQKIHQAAVACPFCHKVFEVGYKPSIDEALDRYAKDHKVKLKAEKAKGRAMGHEQPTDVRHG